MSASATQQSDDASGFLLSRREWKIVNISTGLVILNAVMMFLFAMTPLAIVNRYLFAIPIVGMVVYSGGLILGEHVARKGVKSGDMPFAVVGVAILEFTYGTFGAGVLSYAPQSLHLPAIVITGVITAALTFAVGAYVYARDKDFDHWGTWSLFAFVGAFITGFLGSLVTPVLILTFVLVLVGFMFRLGYEIWQIKANTRSGDDLIHAIGLYVAVMGVFVHVLQIVLRILKEK